MSSLLTLRRQEYELVQQILNQGGEVTDNEDERLAELESQIKAKTETYIGLVMKDGFFDNEVNKANQLIDEAKDYIKSLKNSKERIEKILCFLSEEKGYIEYRNGEGTPSMYIKSFYKQHTHINMDLVEPEEGSYEVKLDPVTLISMLQKYPELFSNFKHTAILADLKRFSHDRDGNVLKALDGEPLVKQHPAVSIETIPSVKFVKNKPK